MEAENCFAGFILLFSQAPHEAKWRYKLSTCMSFSTEQLTNHQNKKFCSNCVKNFAACWMLFFSKFISKSTGFFYTSLLLSIFNENLTNFYKFLNMPFGLIIVLLILFSKLLWIFAIAFKLLWIQVACTNRQIPAVAHLICQCTNTYTLIHKPWALSTSGISHLCMHCVPDYSSPKYALLWHCQLVWHKDAHLLSALSYRWRFETRSKTLHFHLCRGKVILF